MVGDEAEEEGTGIIEEGGAHHLLEADANYNACIIVMLLVSNVNYLTVTHFKETDGTNNTYLLL